MATLVRPATRRMVTPATDSSRWDRFVPRDDDIIIATWSKSGTTWTQRIVDLLVFGDTDVRPVGQMSRWLDSAFFYPVEEDLAALEAQTQRRQVKSHLPLDALPLWEEVKYIHVGRDGRDARISFHNHALGFKPEFRERIGRRAAELAAKSAAGGQGSPTSSAPIPPDVGDYLRAWIDELEAAPPAGPQGDPGYFGHEATFWAERTRPNLLLVHYNDLKEDLPGEMARIGAFLEIQTPPEIMPALIEAAGFSAMKAQGDALNPRIAEAFDRGADRFMHQGRSGRWREYLSDADAARYEVLATKRAGPELAAWLAGGRRGAGEP